MELTVDQALQQGVAAHKEGKLQDAERLYRAILQAQPKHPDANHNLGILAVSVGKPLEAIPFFKLALEINPKLEQFWLSYIDALIKVERFDEAKRVLVESEKSGVSLEKLDALHQRLQGSVPNDPNKTAKGQTLSEKRKKLAEKKKTKERKGQRSLLGAAPSEEQLNHLLGHYQAGRLQEAEALATSLTQQFPKHPFGWKVLGAVFQQTGRLAESLAPMQSAVTLSPQDAEAHYNLGNTLKEQGRLDEAEASYGQAIALKPDYAEAHSNLGNTLKELGRLDEAGASYRRAIALKADYAKAHYNLGNTLKELGRLDEAEASYKQAIALRPDYAEAHYNLGNTLKELGRLDESEASLRQAIAVKPDYAEAHNNLGVTLKELGRLDEAEASYRQAITLKPDYAEALRNVLKLPLGQLDPKTLELCEGAFPTPKEAEQDQADYSFFRAYLLKHRGLLDQSFSEFRKANRLKFETIQTDLALQSKRYTQSLIRIKEWVPNAPVIDNQGLAKLFIVGPSRSGKSSLEHILCKSSQVKPLFEAVNYSSLSHADINETDLCGLLFDRIFSYGEEELLLQGYRVVTSANPASVFYADYLVDMLPNAYFLVVRRDTQDLSAEIFTTQYNARSRNYYSHNKNAISNYLSVYKEICGVLQSKVPDRCVSVNFDDIIGSPEDALKRIGELVSQRFDVGSRNKRSTMLNSASIFRDHFAKLSRED